MTDQAQVARVCRAMGIEAVLWCLEFNKPCRVVCEHGSVSMCGREREPRGLPTGPALLEALKGKLEDKAAYTHMRRWDIGNGQKCSVIFLYNKQGKEIGRMNAATELDALLVVCEQAFCGDGES